MLSSAGVRRSLIHAASRQGLPGTDGAAAGLPPEAVDRVLGRLAGASLLTFSVDGASVTVHRLVMRVIRECQRWLGFGGRPHEPTIVQAHDKPASNCRFAKDVNVTQRIWLPLQDAPFQAVAIGELVCIDHSIAGPEPHKRSHIGPGGSRDSYEPRRASEQQGDSQAEPGSSAKVGSGRAGQVAVIQVATRSGVRGLAGRGWVVVDRNYLSGRWRIPIDWLNSRVRDLPGPGPEPHVNPTLEVGIVPVSARGDHRGVGRRRLRVDIVGSADANYQGPNAKPRHNDNQASSDRSPSGQTAAAI